MRVGEKGSGWSKGKGLTDGVGEKDSGWSRGKGLTDQEKYIFEINYWSKMSYKDAN